MANWVELAVSTVNLNAFKKHYDSGMMGNLKTAEGLISQAKSMLKLKDASSFNKMMEKALYWIDVSHDEFEYSIDHYYRNIIPDPVNLKEVDSLIESYTKEFDRIDRLYESTLSESEAHEDNAYDEKKEVKLPVKAGNNELPDDEQEEDAPPAAKSAKADKAEDSEEWIPGIPNNYVIYGGFSLLALSIIMR